MQKVERELRAGYQRSDMSEFLVNVRRDFEQAIAEAVAAKDVELSEAESAYSRLQDLLATRNAELASLRRPVAKVTTEEAKEIFQLWQPQPTIVRGYEAIAAAIDALFETRAAQVVAAEREKHQAVYVRDMQAQVVAAEREKHQAVYVRDMQAQKERHADELAKLKNLAAVEYGQQLKEADQRWQEPLKDVEESRIKELAREHASWASEMRRADKEWQERLARKEDLISQLQAQVKLWLGRASELNSRQERLARVEAERNASIQAEIKNQQAYRQWAVAAAYSESADKAEKLGYYKLSWEIRQLAAKPQEKDATDPAEVYCKVCGWAAGFHSGNCTLAAKSQATDCTCGPTGSGLHLDGCQAASDPRKDRYYGDRPVAHHPPMPEGPIANLIDLEAAANKLATRESSTQSTQGRCDTTGAERFRGPPCRCDTYAGNLGSCRNFLEGSNGRCAYCDHGLACHSAAIAEQMLKDAEIAADRLDRKMGSSLSGAKLPCPACGLFKCPHERFGVEISWRAP